MQKLKGRWVDDYGQVVFNVDGISRLLLNGGGLDGIISDAHQDVDYFGKLYKKWEGFNEAISPLKHYEPPPESVEDYHQKRQNIWFIPESYKKIDIDSWLHSRCFTTDEHSRVDDELNLFKERNMVPILRMLIYLVDFMQSRNIIWGVGRGSSVASFSLYLIGIHRINSLKYNLDIREFLK